jgi:spore coat polysaccharide biosynthesis protein SpsF
MPSPAELVLGAVQLGLPYGATNKTGKPPRAAALKLVARATEAGIRQFDTARSYGDSEDRLGEALAEKRSVRTFTKLSPFAELSSEASRAEVRAAVDDSIEQSLAALRRDRLDCLMLHRAQHMQSHGGAIWERVLERLEDGTVLCVGVSVQSTEDAKRALACRDVRHLQMPFNLLDWRWREAGVIDLIAARADVTVHARSAFLQGILAANDSTVWPRVEGVDAERLVSLIAEIAQDFGRENPADLCLAYVRGQSWVDGVVVGLETEDQLDANLRLFLQRPLTAGQCALIAARMPHVPENLLDPAKWPKA